MGYHSELLIEMQQEKADEQLAKRLGITSEELEELGYRIETDESRDGFIYGYLIFFNDDAPSDILDKVIGLEDNSYVFLPPWEYGNNDYYEDEFDSELFEITPYDTFLTELQNLSDLNETSLSNDKIDKIQKRLIFIGICGTLETYLSDTFITRVLANDIYIQNFVESYPEFRNVKFNLKNIYTELAKIKETVKRTVGDIIYHNYRKVREMYRATFKVEFPSLKPIMPSLPIRHDLVHRNGKSKDGNIREVTKKDVTDLIEVVKKFVLEIETELSSIQS